MMRKMLWLAWVLWFLYVPPVSAQVANPATVEFDASADHNAVILGGTTPMLTRYELRIFLSGATAPISVQDLGKPTPVSGKITVTNRAWFVSLAMNMVHVAKVAAIGPGGEGVSLASNPFGNVGPPAAPVNAPVVR